MKTSVAGESLSVRVRVASVTLPGKIVESGLVPASLSLSESSLASTTMDSAASASAIVHGDERYRL